MRKFIYAFIFLFSIIYNLQAINHFTSSWGYKNNNLLTHGTQITHHYKIIMDAGSSGTRIYLYKNLESNANIIPNLSELIYKRKNIPLASLVNNESGVDNLVTSLLAYIDSEVYIDKTIVTQHKAEIQVNVLATAGMRKVSDADQQQIYAYVKKSIIKNGYMVGDTRTLQGYEEAIFSWASLNYLKHNFSKNTTTASLEVGGSSMQIVFELPVNYNRGLEVYNKSARVKIIMVIGMAYHLLPIF